MGGDADAARTAGGSSGTPRKVNSNQLRCGRRPHLDGRNVKPGNRDAAVFIEPNDQAPACWADTSVVGGSDQIESKYGLSLCTIGQFNPVIPPIS